MPDPINVSVTTAATKPGYSTTEFWLTTAVTIVGLLAASGAIVPDSAFGKILGLAASLLATLGYTYARSAVKAADAKAP